LSKAENDNGPKKRESRRRFRVLELFSGCGGFSHGFFRTGEFEIVAGVDIKEEALETFRRNHQHPRGLSPEIIKGDVREIEIRDLEALLENRGMGTNELDCLIGGPPCQGFSQLRRSEERENNGIVRFGGYNRLNEDPRNDLVLRFLEIAESLRP
jgi:site-specific DNA-cytosine methylase